MHTTNILKVPGVSQSHTLRSIRCSAVPECLMLYLYGHSPSQSKQWQNFNGRLVRMWVAVFGNTGYEEVKAGYEARILKKTPKILSAGSGSVVFMASMYFKVTIYNIMRDHAHVHRHDCVTACVCDRELCTLQARRKLHALLYLKSAEAYLRPLVRLLEVSNLLGCLVFHNFVAKSTNYVVIFLWYWNKEKKTTVTQGGAFLLA